MHDIAGSFVRELSNVNVADFFEQTLPSPGVGMKVGGIVELL